MHSRLKLQDGIADGSRCPRRNIRHRQAIGHPSYTPVAEIWQPAHDDAPTATHKQVDPLFRR